MEGMDQSQASVEATQESRGAPLRAMSRALKTGERVAHDIVQFIVSNQLGPGDALPREKEMLETLGVSRYPLREGLRILESQGVIEVRTGPRGGPIVSRQDPADLANSLSLKLELMGVTFDAAITARIAIEPAIATVAATQRTSEQLAGLEAAVGRMREAVPVKDKFSDEYVIYHQLLAEATNHPILQVFGTTLRRISETDYKYEVRFGTRSASLTAAAHERLTASVRRRDGEAAASEMESHMQLLRSSIARQTPEILERRIYWTI